MGHIACMEEMISAYKIIVGIPKERYDLGICMYRFQDNVRV
jgi:hypothetical protein